MKRLLAFFLALTLVMGLLPAIAPEASAEEAPETYTYNTYMPDLGGCWNPHTWATSADSEMMSYLESPLANLTIKDSEMGVYQWIFVAATNIQDVTAQNLEDLVQYGCDDTNATAGYVYEITLREEMRWEDGTPINADTYIYSMKALLDPTMDNYRAFEHTNDMLAGAYNYVYQGSSLTFDGVDLSTLVKGEDGVYTTQDGKKVWIALETELDWLGGYTLDFYVNYFGATYFDLDAYATLRDMADENGNVAVTDESLATLLAVISVPAWGEGAGYEGYYICYEEIFPVCSFEETVGLYKVDDYTIRYVCANYCDYYYFLTSCTSNWLVYEKLYEAGKDTSGELVTTNYGTSFDTTMSYGAYRMESLTEGNQVVFVQNENYWEYTRNEDGTLSSVTFFEVDGAYVPQYQTTRVVIDVISAENAEQAFLSGQLDEWAPPADELGQYMTSDQLYQVDEIYTARLFFHNNLDSLKAMDQAGNQNSVVLSNDNFRKAMSLAINRADWVTATSGYKPAIGLLNTLYYYDVYRDPSSVYRYSDEAMQAICNLYGVEYGAGTPYATLRDAYKSITGYNLTEAKALFTTACQELVEAGLYTAGDPITIQIAYSAGAMTASANQQVALLQGYINAAFEGTGFGTFTLTAVDNLNDRYGYVANGVYAIGYGAWGGAAFYPFSAIGCYTDADYAGTIHEMGCWDPAATYLTLTIDGEEVTMTYTEWSRSIKGTGVYAAAEAEVKLTILAGLEQNILNLYYCIPLASMASASLLSYQVSYYTEEYNIMYGFGGMRLMRYNYSDAEWAAYVESVGGTLDYGQDTTPSGPAILASGTCGENVTWTLNKNGLLTISGTGEMENYSFDGAPWYSYASDISAVIMEGGVTSIGDFAFYECSSMTNITIPDSVTSIGQWAFAACVNLTGIAIPDTVTSIGLSAFRACSGLESIAIPSGVTSIRNFTFYGCRGLTSIIIPSGITSIGDYAFNNCSSLAEITFAGDAPSIGAKAFSGVTATVYYPAGNDTWTEDVMQSYGDTLTWVAYESEDSCDNGHNYEAVVTAPTWKDAGYTTYTCAVCGDSYVGDYTDPLDYGDLTDTMIFSTDGVAYLFDENGELYKTYTGWMTEIYEIEEDYDINCGCYMATTPWFSDTLWVTRVIIEDGVAPVSTAHWLADFGKLTEVTIPGSITSIGACMFYTCFSLTEIYFEGDVLSIGDFAFESCTRLESIIIPDGVTSIGDFAFDYCINLAEITFAGDAPSIGAKAFSHVTATVYYPAGNDTWTEDVMQNYGGTLTWVAYEKEEDETDDVIYDLPEDGSVTIPENDCFDPDTVVTVEKVEKGEAYETAVQIMDTVAEEYVVFEINATKDNVEVQPNGSLLVTFAIPEGFGDNVAVYYMAEDGTLEMLAVTVDAENRTVSVELAHFSTYILVNMDSQITQSLLGDVNGDGNVNYLDAMLIAQFYVGDIGADGLDADAADVNGDGQVNYLDAMLVAQYYVGDIDAFPAEE